MGGGGGMDTQAANFWAFVVQNRSQNKWKAVLIWASLVPSEDLGGILTKWASPEMGTEGALKPI